MEVVVIQPLAYDEAQIICDHIKAKRPVVLNLEKMEKNVAQRIMDFVSGSCYTLNGNLQRITNNIFIIAPENVDVAGDFREELKSNGIILPWKNE
jgi:cell division inhibitor SepF